MRAVNLLPERHRPRRSTGGRRGSSYVVLGVLGAVLLGVLFYVLTLNSINSDRDQVAAAKAETVRLQAEAQQLGPYGNFDKVKTLRVQAVRQLAQGRFDWERLVRELARVLPTGVWVTSANAADSAASAQANGASAPAAADSSSADGPSLHIAGCAASQDEVAVTLVRLHELQGASDVQLDHSGKASDASSANSGSSGCGNVHGQPAYEFDADVSFTSQTPTTQPGSVPASLGGGQ